ncbi:MAG: EF-P lysine aminoacylase EpmA [Woeseia sp.]
MTDADWRPAACIATAQRRAAMLDRARRFFAEHDVLQVDTPSLSPAAVSDPHIDSLRTTLSLQRDTELFLRTSPEYAMKRLLSAGYPDIYEIARVYRDGEAGQRHQPEFTLIEWYRRGYSLDDIMQESIALLTALLEPSRLQGSVVYRSYAAAFRELIDVDPVTADLDSLRRASAADGRLAAALGERRDGWLDLLLATRVAPRFESNCLTVLHHYPASQAALARLDPQDPTVAERFEVFYGDLELANGFVELADAAEQARRFARDLADRQSLDKLSAPLDNRLLAALKSGLPDCAGVAVGFERLLMINEKSDDIRSVVTFPFDANWYP